MRYMTYVNTKFCILFCEVKFSAVHLIVQNHKFVRKHQRFVLLATVSGSSTISSNCLWTHREAVYYVLEINISFELQENVSP